ncbi:MAG: HAD-IA family hydrolase [Rhodothermales bacterium]|nr:HAD-IA family hydrolase [Rhodothermales bacterium]MBO6779493.1 HAD-IA family hydrolase [Rhodothermales bacterium]
MSGPEPVLDLDAVRFVYFDLDDTLLDHRAAQDAALADLRDDLRALGAFSLAHVRSSYAAVNRVVWQEYAAGTRDKEGTRSGRFALLFENLGLEEDPVLAADRYLEAYADHWVLLDGASEAVSLIAGKWPVGVLTNGFAEAQRAKLARFPDLTAQFESVVISEEEGVLKPHPKLFRIASQKAGTDPGAILYVGDSISSDVEGGLNAGWQVVWFTAADAQGPDVPRLCDWTAVHALFGV